LTYSKKRKKKKLIRKCLIIIIIIIILIIGIIILLNNKNKDNKNNKVKNDKIKEKAVDVVKLQDAPNNSKEYDLLDNGEYVTSKGYTLTKKDGIAYIDGLMIANKTYGLPSDYIPQDPYNGDATAITCIECIDKTVMEAFKIMQADAKALGLNIYIQSGYRSYKRQEVLFNQYASIDGEEAADKYSSRPGHSEHQTGFCFDLNSIDDSFANTNEGKWVNENAYLYGFVIRFPKGKDEYTGYQYESWHLRFVGEYLAEKLYNNGDWLSIEEYYGITSQY